MFVEFLKQKKADQESCVKDAQKSNNIMIDGILEENRLKNLESESELISMDSEHHFGDPKKPRSNDWYNQFVKIDGSVKKQVLNYEVAYNAKRNLNLK